MIHLESPTAACSPVQLNAAAIHLHSDMPWLQAGPRAIGTLQQLSRLGVSRGRERSDVVPSRLGRLGTLPESKCHSLRPLPPGATRPHRLGDHPIGRSVEEQVVEHVSLSGDRQPDKPAPAKPAISGLPSDVPPARPRQARLGTLKNGACKGRRSSVYKEKDAVETCNELLKESSRAHDYKLARQILQHMSHQKLDWDATTTARVVRLAMSMVAPPPLADHEPSGSLPERRKQSGTRQTWTSVIRQLLAGPLRSLDPRVRRALIRAGPWKGNTVRQVGERNIAEADEERILALLKPARRLQARDPVPIRGALLAGAVTKLITSAPRGMTRSNYKELLRYCLAHCRQVPHPNSALDTFLAIEHDQSRNPATCRAVLQILHLYLHRRFAKDLPRQELIIDFLDRVPPHLRLQPSSDTLLFALKSLRRSGGRARVANDLLELFRQRWPGRLRLHHYDLAWKYVQDDGEMENDVRLKMQADRRAFVDMAGKTSKAPARNLDTGPGEQGSAQGCGQAAPAAAPAPSTRHPSCSTSETRLL